MEVLFATVSVIMFLGWMSERGKRIQAQHYGDLSSKCSMALAKAHRRLIRKHRKLKQAVQDGDAWKMGGDWPS